MQQMTPHVLARELQGWFFNSVREQIFSVDWDGVYPEVDRDGLLTGRVIEASSSQHTIVNVGDDRFHTAGNCSDAMVLTAILDEIGGAE